MDNIYNIYDIDRSSIIHELQEIREKIEECRNNPSEKNNAEYERELIYAQFIKGLKLSVR